MSQSFRYLLVLCMALLVLVGCDDPPADGDVTDGDTTDGDATDGDATDGDATDGDATDGDVDGDVTDGDTTDGDVDEDIVDGDATDGDIDEDIVDGDATDGDVDEDIVDGDADSDVDEDIVDGDTDSDVDEDIVDGDATDGDADEDIIDGDADSDVDEDIVDGDATDGDADEDIIDGDATDGDTSCVDDANEDNDSFDMATGGSWYDWGTNVICGDDEDWYVTYIDHFHHANYDAGSDAILYLYDSSETLLGSTESDPGSLLQLPQCLPAGDYYLRIVSATGEDVPSYSVYIGTSSCEIDGDVDIDGDDEALLSCGEPGACEDTPYKCRDSEVGASCDCELPGSEHAFDINVGTMFLDDTTLYVMNAFGTLYVYDVSDADNPTEQFNVDFTSTFDSPSTMWASGDYLYVADYDGQVCSIDIPSLNPAGNISCVTGLTGSPLSMFIDEETNARRLYLSDRRGYVVIDDTIDDNRFTSLAVTAQVSLGHDTHDMAVSGNIAYLLSRSNQLHVYDISTLDSPSEIKSMDLGGYGWSIALYEPYVFVGGGSTIKVFYVGDLDNPVADDIEEVNEIDLPGNNSYSMITRNGYLFSGSNSFGGVIYDIADPANPTVAGYVPFDISDFKRGPHSSKGSLAANDDLLAFIDTYDSEVFIRQYATCFECADGSELLTDNICYERRTPQAGDIIITEFLPLEKDGVSDGEWFEIVNLSDAILDFSGCTLEDDATDSLTVSDFILPPGEPAVFHANLANTSYADYTYDYSGSSGFSLNNSSDDQIVIVCDASEVARIAYTADELFEQHSLSLDPDFYNVGNYANLDYWCLEEQEVYAYDFSNKTTRFYGTPGEQNSECTDLYCADAIVVGCGDRVGGSMGDGGKNNWDGYYCTSGDVLNQDGKEVRFAFQTDSACTVTATQHETVDSTLMLLAECNNGYCLDQSGDNAYIQWNAELDTTYYMVVDSAGDDYNYDISFECDCNADGDVDGDVDTDDELEIDGDVEEELETCDGCQISGVCYPDGYRDSEGACAICDVNSSTTEWTADDSGYTCRAAVNLCDKTETCNGSSLVCPTDAWKNIGASCSDGSACLFMSGICLPSAQNIECVGLGYYSCGDHGECTGNQQCDCDEGYASQYCDLCASDYQDDDRDGVCTLACSADSACEDTPYLCRNTAEGPSCSCDISNEKTTIASISPNGIYLEGSVLYVIDASKNLLIFDVSDRTQPVQLLSVSLSDSLSSPNSMLIDSGWLYVSDYNGKLCAIDLATLEDSSVRVDCMGVAESPTSLSLSNSGIFTAADREGVILATHDPNFSTDTGWMMVGQIDLNADTQDAIMFGDYVYIARGSSDLVVLDVSDPSSPQTFAVRDLNGDSPWSIAADAPYLYVGSYGEFSIVYVGDLDAPIESEIQEVATQELTGGAVYDLIASDGYLFAGTHLFGISVFDMSDPTAPRSVGAYDFDPAYPFRATGGGNSTASSVAVGSDTLIYTDVYDDNIYLREYATCFACPDYYALDDSNSCVFANDAYEDNDSFAEAAEGPFEATGLTINTTDKDFFYYDVCAGGTLSLDVLFTHAILDIDLVLYDAANQAIKYGTSSNDNESINWTNNDSVEARVVLRVDGIKGDPTSYDLYAEMTNCIVDGDVDDELIDGDLDVEVVEAELEEAPVCSLDCSLQDACPPDASLGCECLLHPENGEVCVPLCSTNSDCPTPPNETLICTPEGHCVPQSL